MIRELYKELDSEKCFLKMKDFNKRYDFILKNGKTYTKREFFVEKTFE